MTAQGHASVRYRRALERRNVFLAETAAREMGRLSLEDSLGLVLLYAEADDPKFQRASVRWLTRLIEERRLTTQQAALAAVALLELPAGMVVARGYSARCFAIDVERSGDPEEPPRAG